jgi:serine/threonine-protein kinase
LLLTRDERVKIADFGIARLFGATQLTTAGGVLGTADYMAPEQVDGRAITDRCDQYALGCVMFALLAGRPPFRAKTMAEMLQMQRYAEPEPVRRYAPDVPAQLDGLIRQLLSKDPAARFPNVMVLARHMEAMQKALSRPGSPERGPSNGRAAAEAGDLDVTAAFGSDATLAPLPEVEIPLETTDSGVYDAPTLAEGVEAASEKSAAAASTLPPEPVPAVKAAPAVREKRFTTVDHDAERAREAESERWLLWLQLAGLAAALAALAGIGWRLTRPATAEVLYGTISAVVAENGKDSLRDVADEIDEFLDRFPEHERAAEVRAFADELELQKLERQLRVRARLAQGESAHPAAAIYAEAIAQSEGNPARSVALLTDLLALYKVGDTPDDTPEADRPYVVLAERQLGIMRKALAKQSAELLPALKQRLAAADKLEAENPERAARMYEALVDIYGDDPWANVVVEHAKARLKALGDAP